ncbi:MAG TPA: phosphoribosylglycinamide formyltransferase [Anaerolineae bacterium]|nr:phosphoribosylglycinamide formyltransferase [Anaerolineae bacterium]
MTSPSSPHSSPPHSLPRIVVLISGTGTNLQALIDAVGDGRLRAEIVLVVSNRRQSYGLERARQGGIPALYAPYKPYREAGRAAYDAALARQIAPYRPDLIVLAGWMRILTPAFLDEFPGKIINLHPALPGQFAGTHAIERAYAAYRRGEIEQSGCMVHYVAPEVDAGPVVGTAVVPLYSDDSLADFEARMHTAEHKLIVEAVGLVIG